MAMNMLLIVLGVSAMGFTQAESTEGANPIRKIVTLLQNMQKEIEAEGAKEQELFDKFMCFCSGNDGDLKKKAADAKASIEELTAKLKSEEAEKVQLGQDLIGHKKDREGAGSDIEEATVLREKEASEYAAEKADSETNIAAMAKAIPALEKGMGGAALLQMPAGDRLKKIVESYPNMDTEDRKNVVAFLQENGDYAPQSGQIVGILKGMKDDMEAELKEAIATEEKSIAGFGELKASKEKEIEMATEAIETKTGRSGEAAVSIVQSKDSLSDTTAELADVEKFIVQLSTECATKEKEWAERQKIRAEEVKAISEAISILNDDDALDVFKKARPSALLQQESLLQKSNSPAGKAKKAQAILAAAASKANSAQLNLLLYTLKSQLKMSSKGKARGLESVIKMIDDMVVLLGKDQSDDDKSKTFCEDELEKTTDEQTAAKEKKASIEASIAEATDAVEALADEIATLEMDIKDLDKTVAQATEQRKEEHADFNEMMQLNEAAMQLIEKAKNRLQKFYNPTLYKAPPKTEDTMEEKIIKAGTFVQIKAHDEDSEDSDVAPPVAPEAPGGAYQKSEKSAGVLGLMDMMVREIETDMKDASYEEKTAQSDYAKLMADSQETRAAYSKGIVTKAASKATLEGKLEASKEADTATATDLDLIASTLGDLHMQCDFLLQNYGLRKEARTNEIESLKNAKAILSGANFR
jgi:predicted  nucleic acid-binding Zn-ribbon protein